MNNIKIDEKNINNSKNNKVKKINFKVILIVLLVVVLIVGATFALVSPSIYIVNNVYSYETRCFDIVYNSGEDIVGGLNPSRDHTGGLNGSLFIGIQENCNTIGNGSLYLTVLDNGTKSSILTKKVSAHCEDKSTLKTLTNYNTEEACTVDSNRIWVTDGTALKYAVFVNNDELPSSVGYVDKNGKIGIYNDFIVSELTQYSIYIWLDGNLVDNSYMNASFSGNISTEITQKSINVQFDTAGGRFFESSSSESYISYTEPGEYKFVAPIRGEYKLEVWGAQGADSGGLGGYGGYSVGTVILNANQNIYINVGGQGIITSGGYNGGGDGSTMSASGTAYKDGGGGGGASHIALISGMLSTMSPTSNLGEILIVAGGGGGGSYISANYNGGSGGGFSGVSGVGRGITTSPGTQLSGYMFGKGQSGLKISGSWGESGRGGGGGGFYGGYASQIGADGIAGGGGGSGYIGHSLLTDKAMYCYGCDTSENVDTLTYSTTEVSAEAISNYAKSGDGAAKITLLGAVEKNIMYGETYGELPAPKKEGYYFAGWYTEPNGQGSLITSETLISNPENHTLYAYWTDAPIYTISYDTNGGDGTFESHSKIHDSDIVLSSDKSQKIGYKFLGWSTDKNATEPMYSPGDVFSLNADTTLYAVWGYLEPIYIYNNGNQYTDITGGWYANKSDSGSTVTFNSNNIYLATSSTSTTYYHAFANTFNSFDFSGYSKMILSLTKSNSVQFFVALTNGWIYSTTSQFSSGTITIDITDFVGKETVTLGLYTAWDAVQSGGTTYIYSVQLAY